MYLRFWDNSFFILKNDKYFLSEDFEINMNFKK